MPPTSAPDYHRAEQQFRAARTAEEKIAALEEMLRVIPSPRARTRPGRHQGTHREAAKDAGEEGGEASAGHLIPTEGAGQIALVGRAKHRKSSLVARLTHAHRRGGLPFTTEMRFGIDSGSRTSRSSSWTCRPVTQHVDPWVFDVIRHAELLWIVVGLRRHARELEGTGRSSRPSASPRTLRRPDSRPDGSADAAGEGCWSPPSRSPPAATGVTSRRFDELLEGPGTPVAVSSMSGQRAELLGEELRGLREFHARLFEGAREARTGSPVHSLPIRSERPATLAERITRTSPRPAISLPDLGTRGLRRPDGPARPRSWPKATSWRPLIGRSEGRRPATRSTDFPRPTSRAKRARRRRRQHVAQSTPTGARVRPSSNEQRRASRIRTPARRRCSATNGITAM